MSARKKKSSLSKMNRLLSDLFTVTKGDIAEAEAKRQKRPSRKRKRR